MDVDIEALAVIGAQKGDEHDWAKLFEWHFHRVYDYCLHLTAGQQGLAEELAQQVFVTAASRINKFRPKKGTFRSWLLGIAKNRFMKLRSKEAIRKRHEGRAFPENHKGHDETARRLQVHEALAMVPAQYRLVLEAKYLEGLTVKQIAEATGRTAKATESLLTRARARFADVFEHVRDKRM